MFKLKKEVLFILVSLIFVIGAGCQSQNVNRKECDGISDSSKKVECLDNFYFQQNECDGIINDELKESCKNGGISLEDQEVVSPFTDDIAIESGGEYPRAVS